MLVTEMAWIRLRGRVDSEMGIEMEIGGLERRCGACDGCGVDGVLWCVWVLTMRERRRKKRKKRKRKRQR